MLGSPLAVFFSPLVVFTLLSIPSRNFGVLSPLVVFFSPLAILAPCVPSHSFFLPSRSFGFPCSPLVVLAPLGSPLAVLACVSAPVRIFAVFCHVFSPPSHSFGSPRLPSRSFRLVLGALWQFCRVLPQLFSPLSQFWLSLCSPLAILVSPHTVFFSPHVLFFSPHTVFYSPHGVFASGVVAGGSKMARRQGENFTSFLN